MDLNNPIASSALVMAVLLLLSLLFVRLRQGAGGAKRPPRQESLDTVADWAPESARILTVAERQSYELLRKALPGFLVLAQVPLARFIRVPTRHSYGDWLQRVGSLSADLLLCDSGSRVLAVIDIRAVQETERSRRRHERLARVLKSAGIRVYVWREGSLPTASQVRALLGAELAPALVAKPINSRPMPLIPIAEMEEILAVGDNAMHDAAMEPVPSAFFDEMESAPTTARR